VREEVTGGERSDKCEPLFVFFFQTLIKINSTLMVILKLLLIN